jgi:hypothetical protein
MVVPIVLIGTAKLEQVVAFQHGNIIAKQLIVSIPETVAGLLRVHVVRAEILSLALAAVELERSGQRGRLRGIAVRPHCQKLRRKL